MGNLEQTMRENNKKKSLFRRLVKYGEHIKAIERYNEKWDKIRKEQEESNFSGD